MHTLVLTYRYIIDAANIWAAGVLGNTHTGYQSRRGRDAGFTTSNPIERMSGGELLVKCIMELPPRLVCGDSKFPFYLLSL